MVSTGEPTGEGGPASGRVSPLLNKDKMSDPGGEEEGTWAKRFTDDMKKTYESIWSEENRMWSLITCSLMFQVGYYAQVVLLYGILLPTQVKEIVGGASKAKVLGLTMFGTSFISICGPPIVGMYSDACKSRYGRRTPYMAVGTITNCVGLIGMGFSAQLKSLWLLEIAFIIVTFGMMLASTAFNATIPDLVPADKYGTASGIMGALGVIGFASGTALGASIAELKEPATYAILSSITCITAFITLIAMSEPPSLDSTVQLPTWRQFLKDVWAPFKIHDFRYVFVTRLCVQMGCSPYKNISYILSTMY